MGKKARVGGFKERQAWDISARVVSNHPTAQQAKCQQHVAGRRTRELRVGPQLEGVHAGPRNPPHRVLELERVVRHPRAADVEDIAARLNSTPIVLRQGGDGALVDVVHEARHLSAISFVKAGR